MDKKEYTIQELINEIDSLKSRNKELEERLLVKRKKINDYVQNLEYIIKITNIGTWKWNVKTGEAAFDDRWAEIIGYTLEELEPIDIHTWEKHVHPEDLEKSMKALDKHFRKETEFYEFESRMKHKNGDWVWVLDSNLVICQERILKENKRSS